MAFDIYFLHIWYFFNMSRWIFFYKCIFMQFFNHFSPPDVASVIVPIVHIVSDVVSVSVTVPDGAVHNTVFLYLYLCLVSVFTHCYDILSQTICYYLFISYLLIICIFIS